MGFPSGSVGKESACNAGDLGSIPGLGKSPGEGNGNPLQYSCLENSMDRGAWQAIVHRIAVGHDCETNFHFQLLIHCISTTAINLKKQVILDCLLDILNVICCEECGFY